MTTRPTTSLRGRPAGDNRFGAKFHHSDELAVRNDEELQHSAGDLYDEMSSRKLALGSAGAIPFEIELAYIQREQELRRVRKAKHREFQTANRYEFVDERDLPEYLGNRVPDWIDLS